MFNSHDEQDILKMIQGKQYVPDEFGRVVIDDPVIIELIKDRLGSSSSEGLETLWNGACSNSRCSLA